MNCGTKILHERGKGVIIYVDYHNGWQKKE